MHELTSRRLYQNLLSRTQQEISDFVLEITFNCNPFFSLRMTAPPPPRSVKDKTSAGTTGNSFYPLQPPLYH